MTPVQQRSCCRAAQPVDPADGWRPYKAEAVIEGPILCRSNSWFGIRGNSKGIEAVHGLPALSICLSREMQALVSMGTLHNLICDKAHLDFPAPPRSSTASGLSQVSLSSFSTVMISSHILALALTFSSSCCR